MRIETIGIVGAGPRGAAIAQFCSSAELQVLVSDSNAVALDKACRIIQQRLGQEVAQQQLSQLAAERTLNRIRFGTDLELLAGADLIIVTDTEHKLGGGIGSGNGKLDQELGVESQRSLFQQLESLCEPSTILAISTLPVSIHQIAAQCSHPQRIVGLGFLNLDQPKPQLKISGTAQTDSEVLRHLHQLVVALGTIPDTAPGTTPATAPATAPFESSASGG